MTDNDNILDEILNEVESADACVDNPTQETIEKMINHLEKAKNLSDKLE